MQIRPVGGLMSTRNLPELAPFHNLASKSPLPRQSRCTRDTDWFVPIDWLLHGKVTRDLELRPRQRNIQSNYLADWRLHARRWTPDY